MSEGLVMPQSDGHGWVDLSALADTFNLDPVYLMVAPSDDITLTLHGRERDRHFTICGGAYDPQTGAVHRLRLCERGVGTP